MTTNETARSIIQSAGTASLGTISQSGHPFVSLVTIAASSPTTLVMLLSGLAKHTQYLMNDGRCCLLVTDPQSESTDPLAGARVSVIGHATRLPRGDDATERAVFLDRHPSAGMYADFEDFAFFRFQVEQGHLVAGFGRIETLQLDQF
tara:strand:+ start:46399 stop:46842 length:444 start_codon:yes stop_codon:yes gene_type:complete